MILKMSKRRGAKFKGPPNYQEPKSSHRHQLLVHNQNDSSVGIRGKSSNLVIFIVECLLLTILLYELIRYTQNSKHSLNASAQSTNQQQLITPETGLHVQLSPETEANERTINHSSINTQSRYSSDEDELLEDRNNNKDAARTSKHLKKLLARPRHILFSFVPHTLTKQLVIKRPNNLMMSLKLKRFQEKLRISSKEGSKQQAIPDRGIAAQRQYHLSRHHHHLLGTHHQNLQPLQFHLVGAQKPLQDGANYLQLEALQVRPLILSTPSISMPNQHELNHQIAILNEPQQQFVAETRRPLEPIDIESQPDEDDVSGSGSTGNNGSGSSGGDSDDRGNAERELEHYDQLIKSEYESHLNDGQGYQNSDDRLRVQGLDQMVGNSSFRSTTQASVEPHEEGGSSWPHGSEGRQVEASYLVPSAQSSVHPPWRPAVDYAQVEPPRMQSRRHNNNNRQVELNVTESGPVVSFRHSTVDRMPQIATVKDEQNESPTASRFGRRHQHLARNNLPLARLPGTSNQLLAQQQQQPFVPTTLETIAQLRLNTHNNNNNNNNYNNNNSNNTYSEPPESLLTNGTKSSSPGLLQTTYQKVPTPSHLQPPHLVHHHRTNKPASMGLHLVARPHLSSGRHQPSYQQQQVVAIDFPQAHNFPAPPSESQDRDSKLDRTRRPLNGHQHNKPPDSIGQIISSMKSPTLSGSPDSSQRKEDATAALSGAATGVGGSGETAGDGGHSMALSETLRRLRETKARIRQLQAELNVSDPNLLLLTANHTSALHRLQDTAAGNEGKYYDDDDDDQGDDGPVNADVNSVSPGRPASGLLMGDTFSGLSSLSAHLSPPPPSPHTNSHQDWFRHWPPHPVAALNGSVQADGNRQFANRSLLLKETSSQVVRAHESMNLPLGMYHSAGPLAAPVRLVASAFGRAAKTSAPSPMPPSGSHWSMFSRPAHLTSDGSSTPVLVGSSMFVGDPSGDPSAGGGNRLSMHQHDDGDTNTFRLSPGQPAESSNNNNSTRDISWDAASSTSSKEAAVGQRLGSQLAGESHQQLAHTHHKGAGAQVVADSPPTAHNGHSAMGNLTAGQRPGAELVPSESVGPDNGAGSSSNQNGNNGNGRFGFDANQLVAATARYPHNQHLPADLGGQQRQVNLTQALQDQQQQQQHRVRQQRGPDSAGDRKLLASGIQSQPSIGSGAVGGVISSSVSSRIAGDGRNYDAKTLPNVDTFSGFGDGQLATKQPASQDPSQNQDSVNLLLAPAAGDRSPVKEIQREMGARNSSSGSSIGQLFSKLFQKLTFASGHEQAPGRQSLQQPNSTTAITPTMAPTNPVESKLTTEKVLHTLIAFSCSLALLCLFVVVVTVRCQMRARKQQQQQGRRRMSSTGELMQHSSSGQSSASSPQQQRDWRRNLAGFVSGSGRGAVTKGADRLILDGTMRNVSMMAKHLCTSVGRSAASKLDRKLAANPLLKKTACCHCVGCSESSWLFRDSSSASSASNRSSAGKQSCHAHTTLCSSGFYHPASRAKLPFGAASSVNKFLQPQPAQQASATITYRHQQPAAVDPTAVAAEMLRSPLGNRGPVGGTRLRMMSAIEERGSPELRAPDCICGQCRPAPSAGNSIGAQPEARSLDLERLTAAAGARCDCLLLEAAAAAADSGFECNCGGEAADRRLANGVPSLDRVEMSLNDDGVITGGNSMDANCRQFDSINEPARRQQQLAITSAKTTTTTNNTNTSAAAAATLTNCCESLAGGRCAGQCCKLRAKHEQLDTTANGCACGVAEQPGAVSGAADSARTTSAKMVLSPVNVKLQATGGNSLAEEDAAELEEHQRTDNHQRVRARVREFNSQQPGKGGESACCSPHDTSNTLASAAAAAKVVDRSGVMRRATSTGTRIAALASSPLSLAASIHGKLMRKTMATGANTAAVAPRPSDLKQKSVMQHGSLLASSTDQVSGNAKQRQPKRDPASGAQELRIEVQEPTSSSSKLIATAANKQKQSTRSKFQKLR